MIDSRHPASFSRRWMTACLTASALCLPALVAGTASAQIIPQIKPPVKPAPVVKTLTISPRVDRIAGIATNPCGNRSTLFERGVTPPLLRAPTGGVAAIGRTVTTPPKVSGPVQPAQASPYAEVLGGANGALSALQFTGPVMDTISRAELIIGTGAAREVQIIGRFAPSTQCEGRFGKGNGAVTLSLPLPDVSVRTTAKIRLYGFPRAVIQDAIGGRLCFLDPELGVTEPVLCTDTRVPNKPAPLAEEIELVIIPQFQLNRVVSPTNGFSTTAERVGGRVQVSGRNLGAALFPDQIEAGYSLARGISRTNTEWVGELFRDFPNAPASADMLIQPRVSLMRRTERVNSSIWDTAQDNNGRLLSLLRIKFERRAGTPPPPPPPPPSAVIDGFDPGNLLYITSGGTTTVGNLPGESGQVLTALASTRWCSALPQPAPGANGTRTVAQGVTTLGPINWGIRNRGNAAFNGTVTAELRLGNQTVDRMTFTGALQPNETRQQAFQRPTTQVAVARESLGPVCYHVGLESDPVVENRGYTIRITSPGSETEALRSIN